jgi:transcriptional regulator with XRE-family HTH domain
MAGGSGGAEEIMEEKQKRRRVEGREIPSDIQVLVALRHDFGLSQSEFGKRAGVPQVIVSRFEIGKGIRPDSESAIRFAYAKLQAKRSDQQIKPTAKRGPGRPRNIENKPAAAKNKADDLIDDMDKCMKPQRVKRRRGRRTVRHDRHVGKIDTAWLKRQTESFLRQNCTAIVERDRLAHFVLSTDAVYEYGRTILLAAGKNVE